MNDTLAPEPVSTGYVDAGDDVELYYEVLEPAEVGPDTGTILLVMGLATQLIGWPDGFVQGLLDEGLRVVRYDNRDVGLSSRTPGPAPRAVRLFARSMLRRDVTDRVPYTLADMADDAVAVLDHLDLDTAHVVGASMGGMIAQELAIHHADRLDSVTSIMSTTGRPGVGGASPAALKIILGTPPTERDALVEYAKESWQVLGGPLADPEFVAERTLAALDRGPNPDASAFHLAAIAASGDRTKALHEVDVPFLVIHGRIDPLVHVSGGKATAKAVPGADLVLLADMAHDLPAPLWPQIVAAITTKIARVRSGV